MTTSQPSPGTDAPSATTVAVTRRLRALLDGPPAARNLERALRDLAKWRSGLIVNTLVARGQTRVPQGPFAGMVYAGGASEGAAAARMLGTYEANLAPVIEAIIAGDYQAVMDVGSAEGYYAVGLALRMPRAQVFAYDTDPVARSRCAEMARLNGVSDRVTISETCGHADFDIARSRRTVVICDIEGAEATLLDPVRAPGLLVADILVELHDVFRPGLTDMIRDRFSASHNITRIDRSISAVSLPDWMDRLSDLDRLLALWEWRAGPTPWLWMTAHD